MKTLLSLLAATLTALALAGCATSGVKPQIPPGTDLTRYRTFAVLPAGGGQSAELLPAKSAMATAVSDAATRTLVSKGLRLAGAAEADLLVAISGSAVPTPAYDYRQPVLTRTGTLDVYYMNSVFPQTQTLCKVTVELKDRATQKVVWQAYQNETLMTWPSPQAVANITKYILAGYPNLSAP